MHSSCIWVAHDTLKNGYLHGSTVTSSTDIVFLPSLEATVYVTGGTEPVKPGAGVKVACPFGRITSEPVTSPVKGSVIVMRLVPGLYTVLSPGIVKLTIEPVVPFGRAVLPNRFVETAAPLEVSASLPSAKEAVQQKVKAHDC